MNRFNEFTRERQYLHNVSLAMGYNIAFKWLPPARPTQDELKMKAEKHLAHVERGSSQLCRQLMAGHFLKAVIS
jgi:hypothetical protein